MGRRTTQKIIARLKEIRRTVGKLYQIDDMLLFGSRARGDELLGSDVDVIIISKDFEHIPFRKRPDAFLDAWKEPVDLEIICYSPAEFKRKQKEYGLVREAMKYAKKL